MSISTSIYWGGVHKSAKLRLAGGRLFLRTFVLFIRVRSAKFYVSTGLFERVTTCLRMFVEEIVQC